MEPPDPSKPYFLSQTRQKIFWILGSENGVPSRLAPTSHAIRPTRGTWRCLSSSLSRLVSLQKYPCSLPLPLILCSKCWRWHDICVPPVILTPAEPTKTCHLIQLLSEAVNFKSPVLLNKKGCNMQGVTSLISLEQIFQFGKIIVQL